MPEYQNNWWFNISTTPHSPGREVGVLAQFGVQLLQPKDGPVPVEGHAVEQVEACAEADQERAGVHHL